MHMASTVSLASPRVHAPDRRCRLPIKLVEKLLCNKSQLQATEPPKVGTLLPPKIVEQWRFGGAWVGQTCLPVFPITFPSLPFQMLQLSRKSAIGVESARDTYSAV